LLEMVDDVRMFANADLRVRGIINTLYDERTIHGRFVLDDVKERYGLEVLEPPVRRCGPLRRSPRTRALHFATCAIVGRCRGLPRPRP